jgi:hypothetical protein
LAQDIPIALPGQLNILPGDLLGLLLKGMQDVDSFNELGHVEDPMFHSRSNPQLINAGAYVADGLPVIRLEALLDQMQLVTGNTPGVLGESSQVLEGGACPEERFHGREALYKFLYTEARAWVSTPSYPERWPRTARTDVADACFVW